MSAEGRLAEIVARLFLAIFLIAYGLWEMVKSYASEEEPFGPYRNLNDCIAHNLDKRNPTQYCRKIRSKVRRARELKYGR